LTSVPPLGGVAVGTGVGDGPGVGVGDGRGVGVGVGDGGVSVGTGVGVGSGEGVKAIGMFSRSAQRLPAPQPLLLSPSQQVFSASSRITSALMKLGSGAGGGETQVSRRIRLHSSLGSAGTS
jgi:hypothetical protein